MDLRLRRHACARATGAYRTGPGRHREGGGRSQVVSRGDAGGQRAGERVTRTRGIHCRHARRRGQGNRFRAGLLE